MKKLLLILAMTGLLAAETRVDIRRQVIVRGPDVEAGQLLLVDEDGESIATVQLGEGLTVDWTTTPPTINAVGGSGSLGDLQRMTYRLANAMVDIVIPAALNPVNLMVICSGLIQSPGAEDEGADYLVQGTAVHFHPGSVPQAGWVVQLLYRPSE